MIRLADAAILALAYLGAFLVRLQFGTPASGWEMAAASAIPAVGLQFLLLTVLRLNVPYHWRMRGASLPRYALAFAVSALLLLSLRVALASQAYAWARPPYSVTLIDAVFGFAGIVFFRFLRERYCADRYRLAPMMCAPRSADVPTEADWLRGKVVMVTGAGGSIGSEIVRQVAAAGAARVLMVERGENALYRIDLEMRAKVRAGTVAVPVMIDINEETKVKAVFEAERPEVVFHAAAYKHVPMCEANPVEARRNNTEATRKLVALARAAGVGRLVFISTDKAVNPKCVMGVTKRDAEAFVLEAGYAVVRFGNVFGSSGSVVELWREQIARGGPVTVTDARMTRYFMRVEEAVGLVLLAGRLEGGCVYTLDMGRPVRIVDLAERMIRAAGFRPYVDVPIAFTGVRPGEKFEEELGLESATAMKTQYRKIYRSKPAEA